MAKLQINTGAKSYDIEDENGKLLGTIVIYPNDLNLASRIKTAEKNITAIVEKAEVLSNSDEDVTDAILELDQQIKDELDKLFLSDVSEKVFKGLNCLNLNKGEYFIVRFLDMITPVITHELEKAMKESDNRINKYASQASKR